MKILFIAPSCFPVDDAEAICNIRLLKALSQSGDFEIDLVTKKSKWHKYPSLDFDSYGAKVNSLNIVEVDNKVNLRTLVQTLMCGFYFGIFYKGCHWAYAALPVVKKLVRQNKYDYVVTKNSPSYMLGDYLKRKYCMKWVASWNDPAPSSKYPAPYGKGLDGGTSLTDSLIIKKMQNADFHLFPSQRLCNHMNHYLKVSEEKCRITPHVIFDIPKIKKDTSHCLRMIHSGNVGGHRNPYNFILALKNYLEKNPDANIHFSILGHVNPSILSVVKEMNMVDTVDYIEPVPYQKSIEILNKFDLAVVIEADCDEGVFLPTKVCDFVENHLSVLAVSPEEGVLHDMQEKGMIGYFASIRNIASIENEIAVIYNDFCRTSLRESLYTPDFGVNNINNIYLQL